MEKRVRKRGSKEKREAMQMSERDREEKEEDWATLGKID